ncbi:hypothetical protein ACHAXS_011012 [Conticribra weissflogii]
MTSDIAQLLLLFCLYSNVAVSNGFSPPVSKQRNRRVLQIRTTAVKFHLGTRRSSVPSCCTIDGSDAVNPLDRDVDKLGLDPLSSKAHIAHELPGNRLLVFGLGNVGTLVAKSASIASKSGEDKFFKQVYGTVRRRRDRETPRNDQHASESEVENNGGSINNISSDANDDVQVIEFGSHEELRTLLPSCTHVLVTIPPINSFEWNGEENFLDITNAEHTNNNNATKETIFVGGRPRVWPREWKICCDPVLNHPLLSFADLIRPNTWVGYISSTSVYGNHNGEWVNETSSINCEPGSKGELYFRAETEWRSAAEKFGWKLNVFRCAGLYGNGRSALHTVRKRMMMNGDFVSPECEDLGMGTGKERGDKEYPTSRIHEADVTRALLGSMLKFNDQDSLSCHTWNLADDHPAPRCDVMAFAANMIIKENNTPLNHDKQDEAKLQRKINTTIPVKSERDLRRKTDKKRVSNILAKQMLMPDGVLLYPTYREGLLAVMSSNKINGKW